VVGVPIGNRLITLLVVLALVALPAVALRVLCIGKSCDTSEATQGAVVPFCPLPGGLRASIAAGFREGRSPDVLGVSDRSGGGVGTQIGPVMEVPWPSVAEPADTAVPIAFVGAGLSGSPPPPGTGLDDIAPTMAQAMGFRIPHPEVGAGEPVPGVALAPSQARTQADVTILIAWKGVGTSDLTAHRDAWPFLRSLVDRGNATLAGTTGSLPVDPAATLTTIGTGGTPSQHGITGTVFRGEDGEVVRAWSPGAPGSVIATLADDLDRSDAQAARVAAVLDDRSDRGIVGDGWYEDVRDRDEIVVTDHPLTAVTRLLDRGFGTDGEQALLGVTLAGSVGELDRTTDAIVDAFDARGIGAAVAVTGTGSLHGPKATPASGLADRLEIAVGAPAVAAPGSDGLFLDRAVSAERGVTSNDLAVATRGLRAPSGEPLFADAFPSFAVAFARYC
jgi:hypothetical protein